ncbi:MAG: hypothetical protein GX799_06370 [Crenarchaeota archaeon]|nr:hypothetical protein [Thermoproteota archaeon]
MNQPLYQTEPQLTDSKDTTLPKHSKRGFHKDNQPTFFNSLFQQRIADINSTPLLDLIDMEAA